jgi:3-mercaptopyruvate sulfurtransferase SseA
MQATAVLFAADHIGYPVKLYDGSFQDWANRKDLPVQ